jgi:hypothetical protein
MSGSLPWKVLALAALVLWGGESFGQRRVMPRRIPSPRRPPTPIPPAQPTSARRNAAPTLTLGTPARPNIAGFPINPNPFIAPGLTLGQAAFNTAVAGRALSTFPPSAFGLPPVLSTAGTGPLLASPLLSTAAGLGNPWLGSASLSTGGGGYSMSTYPGSSYGGYGGYGGYGSYIPPYAAELMGYGDLTRATGDYWKAIQQARISREQSRQMALETQRKRIELERWYDQVRPTAPKVRDREMATDLERARKDPPPTEVWSGRALNELLRSVQHHKLSRTGSPSLDEDVLKNINLSDKASRGNIGMLKDGGRLSWPTSLQESPFDEARKRLSRNIRRAVDQVKNDKEPVEPALLKDINADFKALNSTLSDSADELSPAQYIEARRYLNRLGEAITALSDSRVVHSLDNSRSVKARNVAELVSHMTREGLAFAPATPGDEAAYNALYVALRNYEASLTAASKE